ncbi:MAG: M14 family metallopeptidase, partial [Candidatus Zixiibacteriota bacterium]
MRRTIGFSLIFGLTCFLTAATALAENAKIPKVTVANITKQQYLDMSALGLDVLESKDGTIELLAHPGDLDKLAYLGIPYHVDEPDMASFYATRSGQAFGGYRTFSQILSFLDSLATVFPNIVSPRFSIGQTIEGRDQWVVKMSNNPTVDENKPEVFYNSLIHAREPQGADCLMTYMLYLCNNYGADATVTSVIDTRELYFLIVTNPDGYVYNETTNPAGGGLWRKNRRPLAGGQFGIDLNRNFGYTWGYDDIGSSPTTSSETYRGPSAFSEPETTNLRNFIISRHFSVIHNIHTYSNLVLWPWAHDRWYS